MSRPADKISQDGYNSGTGTEPDDFDLTDNADARLSYQRGGKPAGKLLRTRGSRTCASICETSRRKQKLILAVTGAIFAGTGLGLICMIILRHVEYMGQAPKRKGFENESPFHWALGEVVQTSKAHCIDNGSVNASTSNCTISMPSDAQQWLAISPGNSMVLEYEVHNATGNKIGDFKISFDYESARVMEQNGITVQIGPEVVGQAQNVTVSNSNPAFAKRDEGYSLSSLWSAAKSWISDSFEAYRKTGQIQMLQDRYNANFYKRGFEDKELFAAISSLDASSSSDAEITGVRKTLTKRINALPVEDTHEPLTAHAIEKEYQSAPQAQGQLAGPPPMRI